MCACIIDITHRDICDEGNTWEVRGVHLNCVLLCNYIANAKYYIVSYY